MVYDLFRALPGEPGFIATVTCRSSGKLDASIGAPEPHGFAVRGWHHSSLDASPSIASRANVRDDREPPLL
jgi:hypothetical protein